MFCCFVLSIYVLKYLGIMQTVVLARSINGYYESLPTSRKTVLTNLLQHAMTAIVLNSIHYLAALYLTGTLYTLKMKMVTIIIR